MDISKVVYDSAGVTVSRGPDIFIDEDVEFNSTKPRPLREPRPMKPTEEDLEKSPSDSVVPRSTSNASSFDPIKDSTATKSKRESYDMSGSVFLISNDGKTLSLPVPSDSPSDPLNWSWWKTAGAMLALAWYSASALTIVQAASLLLRGILTEFSEEAIKPWSPESLVTAPTLFMGIGAFLWVPLGLALGRRPVFLLAALLNLIATIGAGYAQSFHGLLGWVCLLGMGEGFALTPAFLMVIDMTFIDRRPKAIAALWSVGAFAGTGAVALVPLLSDHGREWRLFYQRWIAMSALSLLLAFFLYPETFFKRPTVAFNGMILMQSSTEKLTIYEDRDGESGIYRDLPEFPLDSDSPSLLQRVGRSRSPFGSWKAMGRCYLQMGFCALNPLIFWVLIASAFNFAGMMYVGSTFATTLSAPPYSLPSLWISNVNVASALGGLLAYPIAGPLMGKILIYLSKRNRGVREAEHYLIAYIVPVITGALSTLLYGLAVHNHWHFSIYYLAYGLNGLSWVTLSIGNTLWVTEVFPRWAAPAFVVVSGGCYLVSFIMSFALQGWISAQGFLLVGVELAVLQVVSGAIALPIAFWGKSARQRIHGRWADERSGALRPL